MRTGRSMVVTTMLDTTTKELTKPKQRSDESLQWSAIVKCNVCALISALLLSWVVDWRSVNWGQILAYVMAFYFCRAAQSAHWRLAYRIRKQFQLFSSYAIPCSHHQDPYDFYWFLLPASSWSGYHAGPSHLELFQLLEQWWSLQFFRGRNPPDLIGKQLDEAWFPVDLPGNWPTDRSVEAVELQDHHSVGGFSAWGDVCCHGSAGRSAGGQGVPRWFEDQDQRRQAKICNCLVSCLVSC